MVSSLRALSLICATLGATLNVAVASSHLDSLEGFDASPTILRPVYPDTHRCARITSLYGSWIDLDGTRRDVRHEGIDIGEFGGIVLAPSSGVIMAVWETDHGWGKDWSVLIGHADRDLASHDPTIAYYSEFDHLRSDDIDHLRVGDSVARGQEIGVVRHPGGDPQFRAEVHWEVYAVATARRHDLTWDVDGNGNETWWNGSADLIDPLLAMSRGQAGPVDGGVEIVPFEPGVEPSR
jgi:murein DD-endopeptidase MepM/ murein hydrolase activator NlpD